MCCKGFVKRCEGTSLYAWVLWIDVVTNLVHEESNTLHKDTNPINHTETHVY